MFACSNVVRVELGEMPTGPGFVGVGGSMSLVLGDSIEVVVGSPDSSCVVDWSGWFTVAVFAFEIGSGWVTNDCSCWVVVFCGGRVGFVVWSVVWLFRFQCVVTMADFIRNGAVSDVVIVSVSSER